MNDRCTRCDEGVMRSWDELSDAEREVVKRLPASADYSARCARQRIAGARAAGLKRPAASVWSN